MGETKTASVVLVIICFIVLFFAPIKTGKTDASNEARFSVTLSYSYLIAGNGTYEELIGEKVIESTESWLETCAFSMVANCTLKNPFENQTVGGILEYYQIQVDSDKISLMNRSDVIGTVKNSHFSDLVMQFDHPDNRDKYIDTSKMGGGGSWSINWTVGESKLSPSTSANTQTISEKSTASALRAAEAVTVSVYRLGTVIFTENTTQVLLANKELVEQIHLQKRGDGWLYNKLLSEEELTQTNLLNPTLGWEDGIIPEFSSWIVFPLFMIGFLAVVIFRKKL